MSRSPVPYDRSLVARMFDEFAKNQTPEQLLEHREHGAMKQLVDTSVKELALKPSDVLLDAGTGPGTVALQLAPMCRLVIGIDISRAGLSLARQAARARGVRNVVFSFGELEAPDAEMKLTEYRINKVLILRALHHLPDDLKVFCLARISALLVRPARVVVGDIILFEDPDKHHKLWPDVGYDGGVTDRPATDIGLLEAITQSGGSGRIRKLHPLLGVSVADYT